jgi:hypothetical protein
LTLSDCSVFGNSSGNGGNGGSFNDAACEGCLSLQPPVSFSDAPQAPDAPSGAIGTFGVDDVQTFVSNGAPSLNGGMGGNGGGIYNDGTLVLNQCVISGNSTGNGGNGGAALFQGSGGNGGGGGSGGGIYSDGSVILTNCSLTGNLTGAGGNGGSSFGSAGRAGAGGAGAGLENVETGSASFSFFVANHSGRGGDGGVQSGVGTSGGIGGDGAGINNVGVFTVDNATFSGNSTGSGGQGASGHGGVNGGRGGNGGGGANDGSFTVLSCIFDGNFTGNGGGGGGAPFSGGQGGTGGSSGGLQNEGSMSVTASTLSHNFTGVGGDGAGNGGPGGNGGGGGAIQNHGTAFVMACTLNDNKAAKGGTGNPSSGGRGGNGGNGGGVDNGGTITVTSSTVSGNAAGDGGDVFGSFDAAGFGGDGGGICNNGVSVAVVASTIVGNSSGDIGAGFTSGPSAYGSGGGIANLSDPSTFNLLNTLLSSNSVPAAATGPDASGGFSSLGHNFVSITDGSSGFTESGDQTGTATTPLNPRLGPLQDNGGPTFTCLLLPGSSAIDAGDDDILAAPYDIFTDQRGQPRKSGTHVDIGAVEVPMPDVITESATNIKLGSGMLNGSASPNGSAATAYFRWGKTTNYGSVTAGTHLGKGNSWVGIHNLLSGLTPGVAYHFQLAASNNLGVAYGLDQSFTTFVDSDEDGIPNWWTQQYFHHSIGFAGDKSRAKDDADGTGQNNRFKYVAGLNPTNPASVFELRVLCVTNEPLQRDLVFTPMVTGRTYTVEFSTDLAGDIWLPLENCAGPVTNGNQVTITDMNASQSRKFYRIDISLP